MKSTKNTEQKKLNVSRLKDIIAQLTDIIYLLCNAKEEHILMILDEFTNITKEELDTLNIIFPQDSNNRDT